MKLYSLLGLALLCTGLIGCSNQQSKAPHISTMLIEETGQNGRACVRSSRIRGYGILKHDVISIDGHRDYFLATVRPGCLSLSTSIQAAFSGDFGEVCGGINDKIISGGDSCTIRHIFKFDDRKQAFAVYESTLEKRKALKEADNP
jgi:hypothetical protein